MSDHPGVLMTEPTQEVERAAIASVERLCARKEAHHAEIGAVGGLVAVDTAGLRIVLSALRRSEERVGTLEALYEVAETGRVVHHELLVEANRANTALQARASALESEVAELRGDRERLDWLDDQCERVMTVDRAPICDSWEVRGACDSSVRAAIDAARSTRGESSP